VCSVLLSSLLHPPACPTLFPYTTLFRSAVNLAVVEAHAATAMLCSCCSALAWSAARDEAGQAARRRLSPRVSRERDQGSPSTPRSEEHTSELQSRENLVCRLLLEKKKKN